MKIRHACMGLLALAFLSSQSVDAQRGGGGRSGPANRPVEPLPVIQMDNNDTGLTVSKSPSGVAPAPTLEPQVATPGATRDPVTGPVDIDVHPPATVPAPGLDVWQPYMGPTAGSPPNLTYNYPSKAEANTSGGYIAASPGSYGSATTSSSPMPSLPPGNGFVSSSASAVGGYGGYGAVTVSQPGSYGSPGASATALPGGYGYGSAVSATTGSYSNTSPSANTLARGLRQLLQAAAALGGHDTTSDPIIEVPTSPAAADNDADSMGETTRVPDGDAVDTTAATSSGSVGSYGAYASQPAAQGYGTYGSVNGWGYGQISSASAYGGNGTAAAAVPGGYGTAATGRHLLQAAGAELGTATASAADGMPGSEVGSGSAAKVLYQAAVPGSYGAASTAMGYGAGSAEGSPAQQGPSAGGYGYGSQAASVPGSYGQAASTAMGYGGTLPDNGIAAAGALTQGRRLLQGGQEPSIEISQGTLTETGSIDSSTAGTGSDTPSSYTNYGLGGAVGVYTNGGYGDYGYGAGSYGVHGPSGGYGYGFPSASTQSGRRHLLQVAAAQAGTSGEPLIEIPSAAATDAAADGMPGNGADGSYQPAPGSYGAASTAMGYGNLGGNGAYGAAAAPGASGGYGASAAALPGGYGGPSPASALVPGGVGASAAPTGASTGGGRKARRRLLGHIGL